MNKLPRTDSFVVKIWAKKVEDSRGDASWRGSVTHVETGECLYLERLTQIPWFLAPYVLDAGGKLDVRTLMLLCLVSPDGV